MPPIIRHTITITVTEIWTILWPNGQETVWEETHSWPAESEPDSSRLPLSDEDERENNVLAPAAADATSEDE